MPDPADQPARGNRLALRVAERELDLLLVTDLTNVRWLTGFTGTNGACLIGPEARIFLTDFRYAERADSIPGWDAEVITGEWLKGVAGRLEGRVGVEDDRITLREFERLGQEADPGVELIPAGGEVESLRRIKDPAELDAIAAAAELTDGIYRELVDRGMVGRTEIEISGFAVARMREEGAEPSFPPIVAAGPNGASPHAEPSSRSLGRGELVTIDMGSRLDGYCSDCTRTFATGEESDLDDFARGIYAVTLEAQFAGLDAVRAGAEGADVDRAARDVIAAAGYGERFGHGLGHGVGLEIHEAPRLGPRSKDLLAAGEVITVEPGIYVPGKTGLRIEDMVVVGPTGVARNFSSVPKDLTFVG
ncbi:MAG: aminopeptidase P family protein [Solirubrobacterales bacterium]|nr:aminopeptidase P family protein [Solirubrobacterales bacterium]